MTSLNEVVASDLLKIGAVSLQPNDPFTWASGLKSPIYCDNRMTISFPDVRAHIYQGLSETIKANFPDVDVIAGTATAGIPHAAWVAEELDLPMIYVRSKPKDHGQGRQIEGVLSADQKVVLIDDLISTGGSVLGAVDAVRATGATVLGVAAIFSYQLPAADENFGARDLKYVSVTNYETLINVALTNKTISDADLRSLQEWRKNPQKWSDAK